eukprot:44914-Lingulodinium_polyedra.AAC.1
MATLIERAMDSGEIKIPKACRRTPARFVAYALHRFARDPKVSPADKNERVEFEAVMLVPGDRDRDSNRMPSRIRRFCS